MKFSSACYCCLWRPHRQEIPTRLGFRLELAAWSWRCLRCSSLYCSGWAAHCQSRCLILWLRTLCPCACRRCWIGDLCVLALSPLLDPVCESIEELLSRKRVVICPGCYSHSSPRQRTGFVCRFLCVHTNAVDASVVRAMAHLFCFLLFWLLCSWGRIAPDYWSRHPGRCPAAVPLRLFSYL